VGKGEVVRVMVVGGVDALAVVGSGVGKGRRDVAFLGVGRGTNVAYFG
jgi:hypothetical protein